MLDIIITLAQAFRAQHKQLYMVGGTVRDVLLHRGTDSAHYNGAGWRTLWHSAPALWQGYY